MLVGYVGENSAGQSLEIQLRALSDAGCAKVFSKEQSWMSAGARDPLQGALDFVRQGDTLMVTQLDCVAGLSNHLHDIVARLSGRGVKLCWLDPTCPEGRGFAFPGRQIPADEQRQLFAAFSATSAACNGGMNSG